MNRFSPGFELVYDAANGVTTHSNSLDRPLVFGSGQMRIVCGPFKFLTGKIGFHSIFANNATGTVIVDGGTFTCDRFAFGAGDQGAGTLTVTNGRVNFCIWIAV